jgi:hypothetical protein
MKVVVSKKAVREYIKEMISTPSMGWQSTGDLSTAPVGVSAVVDPSAAVTDPSNPNFKPKNRVELKAALSSMIDDISDDDAADFYSSLQDAKETKEEDEMTKGNKVEETVRLAVRKMLSEMGPYRDTGMSYSGPGTGSRSAPEGFDSCEECDGEGELDNGNSCPACKGKGYVKSSKRGYKTGEAEFDKIAGELGFSGAPGARQAMERALSKMKYRMELPPDELEIVTLTAMNDYIEMLKKSGELTAADVQLMKDHPNIVTGLDGFREFLDKALTKAQKASIGEAAEKKAEGPKCPECGKNMSAADKKEYESNSGKGYPRICTSCAEEP